MASSGPQFQMRLVGYTPLGARLGPIPDLGFTISSTAAGPTLDATISTVVYSTLPTYLEVAVEWWHISTQSWSEGRDSRFAITQITSDDRDRTGTVSLTGLGLGVFLLAANQLKGVDPYVNTTGTSETSQTNTSVSVSGTTFTWSGHVLSVGDRVRIVAKGNSKLNSGSVYYVINPTTNTFQLARGATSTTAINAGTASNVSMARVVTRIVFSGSHSFKKSDSVAVVGGSALGLTDNSQYYVTNVTAATIQVTDQPGGVPIELSAASTNVSQVYRYLDGQRVFTNATPGTVMDAVFLEARGRGWGVNPTDSTQQMLHGWTTAAGSDGVAWTKMADDPDTPGISIGFQPGTPGTQILQSMLDNQYAEFYCAGRTIHLVNYGTGNDHSADTAPMRIGTTASAVKVQYDITNQRNAVIVRGTGPILVEYDGTIANGSFGRLEVYETAQGATSKVLAAKQGQTDVTADQNPSIGYTVTEMAQVATWLPLVSYSRGDWVACQLKGTGWTRLRCVQWSFVKDASGAITVTTNLEKVKRTLLSKTAKAQTVTSAGLSTTSTPGSTLQESDNRVPAAPLGITVNSVGYFSADDKALTTATVSWLPVVTDINGADVQATDYDVWIRPEGAQNGHSVGRTATLVIDVPNLASGSFYEVSIRAQSSTGTWGEFSPETEFQAAYAVTIPPTPTTPTVTGHLGQVRVAWDGNLVDASGNTGAPPAGFAWVSVSYSTTQNGTYSPIGSNMGNAGAISISSLAVGSTYWFALTAVNSLGTVSAQSTAVSYTVVGVTGPDLVANSVTANTIAAGAISADKLDLGSVPQQSSPVERVPQPPFVTSYWSTVISGIVPNFTYRQASATSLGLVLAAGGTSGTRMSLTASNLPVPGSGKLFNQVTASGSAVWTLYVVSFDVSGNNLGAVAVPAVGAYVFPTNAVTYSVFVGQFDTTGASTTISQAHVFEVISTISAGQGVELSPAGLQFFDNNNNLAMDLTTNSSQFFSIYNAQGGDPVSVASLDQSGNASFNYVTSDNGYDIAGVLLADPNNPTSIINSAPNGSTWAQAVAYMDRAGRGVIYDVTWPSQNGSSISTAAQYQRIAQDQFTLEDGRSYQFVLQDGGLQATAPSNVNAYLELQINLSPNANPTSGLVMIRSLLAKGTTAGWYLPPVVLTASANQSTFDLNNRLVPAGVPIYWQLNTNLSSAASASWQWNEFGNTRGLTIIDVGSSNLTRPMNGADALADVHDYTSTGSSSGSTSGGTTATSKTVTFTAKSSRTFNNGGSSVVTGSGQYTNGSAMYYGVGVSQMGSWFGNFQNSGGTSMASVLSGKTVTNAVLKVQNTYTAYSSATIQCGTASTNSAPSSIGTPQSNTFSFTTKDGATSSITLGSGARSGLSSGGVQSFVFGVDPNGTSDGNQNYSYFHGASQSNPPTLTVTFH